MYRLTCQSSAGARASAALAASSPPSTSASGRPPRARHRPDQDRDAQRGQHGKPDHDHQRVAASEQHAGHHEPDQAGRLVREDARDKTVVGHEPLADRVERHPQRDGLIAREVDVGQAVDAHGDTGHERAQGHQQEPVDPRAALAQFGR